MQKTEPSDSHGVKKALFHERDAAAHPDQATDRIIDCFLNSWYFRGYGPGYGMLFRLFYAILRYSPLFPDQNVSSISYSRYFLYSVAYP